MMMIMGTPFCVYKIASWAAVRLTSGPSHFVKVRDVAVQADRGMSVSEQRFVQEYTERLCETESLWVKRWKIQGFAQGSSKAVGRKFVDRKGS